MRKNNSNYVIFTDGACLGNPGPGGWASIIKTLSDDVVEIGGAENSTTNNRMEILASLRALEYIEKMPVHDAATVTVYTDSKYLIQGITEWIRGWKRNGWRASTTKEDVKNRDLWEALDEAVIRVSKKYSFSWKHVAGHSGVPANERCDELAVAFAEGRSPNLFKGPASEYEVSFDVPVMSEKSGATKSKEKTLYYLSYVGGQVHRDKTWAECEARVKGHRGAKYKKCTSELQEREILRGWGAS